MALAHSTSGNSRGHHLGLPTPRLLARALSFYLEGITFYFVLDQCQVQRPHQISTGELHTVPCVHESEHLVYTGLQQVLLGMEGQGSLRCQSVERNLSRAVLSLAVGQDKLAELPWASASASAEWGHNTHLRGLY